MAEFSLQALHDEIEADPDGLGYKEIGGDWKGDQVIVDLINAVSAAYQIRREDVSALEVFEAINLEDLKNNPGAADLEWFNALLTTPNPIRLLDDQGNPTQIETNVLSIITSNNNGSRTRLAALRTRNGSRAEMLWGSGISVSAGQVGRAANL